MKSIVERLLRAGSANSIRSHTSNKKIVWKQTPDGKWFKINNSLQAANLEEMSENPLYTPEDIEAPNSFVCGVCSTAMHFRVQVEFDEDFRCSICNQECSRYTVQQTCDNCELYVCCETRQWRRTGELKYKPSCYGSYYDEVKAVRKELYNRQEKVSQFSTEDQKHWLQCMWHDIIHNMNRFRAELRHSSQAETIDTTNASLVVENLGLEMTQSLVRLFVMFQSKFDTDIVEWYSSLIQNQRESLVSIALQTSVKVNSRLEQLKWLVQELRLDVSNCDFSGALRIAAKMGKLDILEYFLEDVGADPTAGDNVAIRIASCNGHLNVVERLLQDDRVDPSAADNYAIRMACEFGHLNVVERLLQDDRVDPSTADNDAIRTACEFGRLNVVERLLQDDRVDPSAENNAALRETSLSGQGNIVKRLLQDDRVDPSADDNYAIRWASSYGYLDVVELLLQDDRVDPSADDNYAIRLASLSGHLNVVERLLQDDRVDPSADCSDAFRKASSNGHLAVVERLLQDVRVDPSANDNSAIQQASCFGHLTVVERLLHDDRVDPSAGNNSAIRLASLNCHFNVIDRLLQDDRVDPSANDNSAIRTASRPVVWWNPTEKLNIVKRLLEDSRVDPAARSCEAIRKANDDKIIKCLYDRTRSIVCFMSDDEYMMKKITPLHNESLVMGGLCLSHMGSADTCGKVLPQDVTLIILLKWASLML